MKNENVKVLPIVPDEPHKLLLIDDSEADYVLTRDLLEGSERARFALDWVPDYEAGIEALARHKHALYLVDYRLGQRDGIEWLREAIAHGCTAPIILLTGEEDYDIDHKAMELGAADFLTKGRLDRTTLERAVRHALERKHIQDALHDSEQRFRSVFENSPDAIFVADLESSILDANRAAGRLHGLEKADIVGKKLLELLPPGDGQALDFPLLVSAPQGRAEALGRRRKGASVPIEIRASRIDYGGTPAMLLHVRDVSEYKRSDEQLRDSREKLRALARRLQSVREHERGRLAREVHDELGQALTALRFDLAWIGKRLGDSGDPGVAEKIATMTQMLLETKQTVRRIATELRPGILDTVGLVAAIEWQAGEFEKRTGIRCAVSTLPEQLTLDQDRSTAVFRIFCETLTNVARHAAATEVGISLRRKKDRFVLEVRDNGRGITEEEISGPKAMGLLGMRERAMVCGGQVQIRGKPGRGTTVTVLVPMEKT